MGLDDPTETGPLTGPPTETGPDTGPTDPDLSAETGPLIDPLTDPDLSIDLGRDLIPLRRDYLALCYLIFSLMDSKA